MHLDAEVEAKEARSLLPNISFIRALDFSTSPSASVMMRSSTKTLTSTTVRPLPHQYTIVSYVLCWKPISLSVASGFAFWGRVACGRLCGTPSLIW